MNNCHERADPNPTPYGIPVIFMRVTGLTASGNSTALLAARAAWLATLRGHPAIEPLVATPRLAGYRELHQRIGKTGRNFVPSPESQLRLLFKRGVWREINPLVDCYSLLALATQVSIGAHDARRISWPLRLTVATGNESVLLLGDTDPQRLSRGEYVYTDARGRPLGRLECRQAAYSQVTAETTDCVFILEGHASLTLSELRDTADQLLDYLQRFVGTWASVEIVSAGA